MLLYVFSWGPDYTEYWCEYARKRWGVKVWTYQHFFGVWLLRNGSFRSEPLDIPMVRMADVKSAARLDSGIEWIGYGYKRRDSLERNAMLSEWPDGICDKRRVFAPIKDWSDREVFAYLNRRRIIDPDRLDGSRSTEINLNPAGWITCGRTGLRTISEF